MPLTLGEKRGFLGLGMVLLLLMTLAAWLNSGKQDQGDGYPSSFSTLPHGGKAAFLLLEQSGYPVERWDKPPLELPVDARATTLILAEPESYPRPEEYSAIIRFVVRGGHVLLAGVQSNLFVPQGTTELGDGRIGLEECVPAIPSHLTRGGEISQDGNLIWKATTAAAVVHFEDRDEDPVVVSYPLAQGQVIWWASTLPLRNDGIRDRGNVDLLLNSVADSKRILWDEYYHREHAYDSGHHNNPAQIWALGQIAFFGLLALLTFSRRSGPLVSLPRESRLSPLEFVETLGNVFERAHGTQVAVEIALNRFQQMVVRRLGIRGVSSPKEMVVAMVQHGLKLPEQEAALVAGSADAATDTDLSEKEALRYVGALIHAMHVLERPIESQERT
jgi:Domain of unknown function (DUF4350)